nr:hypothetical protein [uncultured Cupriavidus sp.]
MHRALGEAIVPVSACHEHLEIFHVIDYTFLQYEIGYGNRADVEPELLNLGYCPARRRGGGR